MFKIEDGRDCFYQWDIDRRLIIDDSSIKYVHFCNKTSNESLVVEAEVIDGVNTCIVPNVLLTTDWRICVYAYIDNYTKLTQTFEVIGRSKPANYVYTEDEVMDYNNVIGEFNNVVDRLTAGVESTVEGLVNEFNKLESHVDEVLLSLGYAEDEVY